MMTKKELEIVSGQSYTLRFSRGNKIIEGKEWTVAAGEETRLSLRCDWATRHEGVRTSRFSDGATNIDYGKIKITLETGEVFCGEYQIGDGDISVKID